MILLSIAALLVCFAWTDAYGQGNFDKVGISPVQIAGSVLMLQGSGGNIGVSIGSDGTLMIDDQFISLVPAIKAAIGELGGEAPIFLLNTHHHGDHMGGNPEFDEGATISHFPPTRFPRSRSTIP